MLGVGWLLGAVHPREGVGGGGVGVGNTDPWTPGDSQACLLGSSGLGVAR